jgi:hypothetical protein
VGFEELRLARADGHSQTSGNFAMGQSIDIVKKQYLSLTFRKPTDCFRQHNSFYNMREATRSGRLLQNTAIMDQLNWTFALLFPKMHHCEIQSHPV